MTGTISGVRIIWGKVQKVCANKKENMNKTIQLPWLDGYCAQKTLSQAGSAGKLSALSQLLKPLLIC